VHCFSSSRWLITVHGGECGVFAELDDDDQVPGVDASPLDHELEPVG
jgi:hypothetical protein